MPNGITPEEERRQQEQERRYQKAEEKARAAWQRGLENEREAAEVLKEEKKTHAGKRRVSFDSSRNQTHLLYSVPSTIDSTPAESTDVGEPSDDLLSERYQLLVKKIASLRAEFAEFEAIKVKQAEAEALARKKQEHEAAWKEQERHRQKAEEEALKVKEADESVLARIRQEGEAARRKWHEAWDEKKRLRQVAEEEALKAKEAEEKALARVKQEYEARKEQERRRQMEKGEIARKRGLENERPSTSQAYPRKPEQGTYPPEPSSQQHPPTKQYPPIDHSHLKHLKHGHPSPRQTPSPSSVPVGLSGLPAGPLCSGPSASPVPIGLSGLPAESLCSDEAQEVARYKDQGQYRSGHTTTYGSKQQELAQQGHPLSAPRLTWSTPSVPAWNVPTPEPQVTKQTLVIPVVRSYHAGVQTPKEQWPLPPTPGHSEKEPEVPTPAESEKKKLERQLREEKMRLRAGIERKGRGNSASSVASWQTGSKSVWEEPTKVTPKTQEVQKSVAETYSRPPVASHQPDTRQSRWERGTEGPKVDSSVNHNDRSLSRTTTRTRYYEADEYLSPSDEDSKLKLTKAQTRAASLKLSVPLGINPPYVPPTPYWHPSPPPSLPPTPPKHSSDNLTPAVAGPSKPSFENEIDYYRDIKTPYLPGGWWG